MNMILLTKVERTDYVNAKPEMKSTEIWINPLHIVSVRRYKVPEKPSVNSEVTTIGDILTVTQQTSDILEQIAKA